MADPAIPRDHATEAIIRAALDEEQQAKRQKKAHKEGIMPVQKAGRKGKTLAEIENEEGGPIKESLAPMAGIKRAAARKPKEMQADDEEVELPPDVDRYEEELAAEEDEGVEFEPFNLKAEREQGTFDEEGNYVEKKDADAEGVGIDAWLTSDEAKVVSPALRRKIEERRQAEEAAAAAAARAAPMTDRQIATLKAEIASHMLPGETLARALKRLSGAAGGGMTTGGGSQARAVGKRERARAAAAAAAATAAAGTGAAGAAAQTAQRNVELFNRVAEVADQLLGEGEMDVYSTVKEDFEKAAAMWLPKQPAAAATTGGTGQPSTNAAAAGVDDDDDMFAAEDKAPTTTTTAAEPAATTNDAAAANEVQDGTAPHVDAMYIANGHAEHVQQTAAASNLPTEPAAAANLATSGEAAAASTTNGAAQEGDVDYASWPIKELKRFLDERGVDSSTYVDKVDLVAKVKEVADKGFDDSAFTAPPGYAFDPSTGYWYNADSDLYYDTSSGGYYHSSTGQWYKLDARSGQFIVWAS